MAIASKTFRLLSGILLIILLVEKTSSMHIFNGPDDVSREIETHLNEPDLNEPNNDNGMLELENLQCFKGCGSRVLFSDSETTPSESEIDEENVTDFYVDITSTEMAEPVLNSTEIKEDGVDIYEQLLDLGLEEIQRRFPYTIFQKCEFIDSVIVENEDSALYQVFHSLVVKNNDEPEWKAEFVISGHANNATPIELCSYELCRL